MCLTGSDNSSCLPGDDYQLVNLPNSNCSSHLFLGERESARSRGNVIVSEAGILSFGSFTVKDGKAHPCLRGSISSVQPIETRLHVFIYPQENLLIHQQVDQSYTSVTYKGRMSCAGIFPSERGAWWQRAGGWHRSSVKENKPVNSLISCHNFLS